MADNPSEQDEPPTPPPPERGRRKSLTPEQRRFLGTPRAGADREREDDLETSSARPASTLSPAQTPVQTEQPTPAVDPEVSPRTPEAATELRKHFSGRETQASRRSEMQRALIIISILVFLAMTFFVGRQFDRLKYFIVSRVNPPDFESGPEKFPGLTSEELVEGALAAEREGDWGGAAQRFFEAKRKDLRYQGLLFRVGKSSYDRGDWDGADYALEYALKFGENVAAANHLRGLIAVRRRDLAAADRFFEAATKAEPLVAEFFYHWGDALRLDQRPRDAIRRYQQAIMRTSSPSDVTLCRFKIRLARIETAEASALYSELEKMREAGALSVDWLMTHAALELNAGRIQSSAQLILQARSRGVAGLFDPCSGDVIFRKAAEAHPEIAFAVTIKAPSG